MHSAPPHVSVLNSSVLVLNRSYMAVRVVTVRRAFVMLYREAAEVIHVEGGSYANYDFSAWCEMSLFWSEELDRAIGEDDDDWIRTVHFGIRVPRVIRLTQYDRQPRPNVRFNRRNLFARDDNRCQYCGRSFPTHQLSFDHVTPRSRGGDTTWENVVTCCLRCNSKKGNRTPQEAGMTLHSRPAVPRHNPSLTVKLSNPRYHTWRPFLAQANCHVEMA